MCVFVVGPGTKKVPCQSVIPGEASHAKSVNIAGNEFEVSALMDSFGNCLCVKSNLLE